MTAFEIRPMKSPGAASAALAAGEGASVAGDSLAGQSALIFAGLLFAGYEMEEPQADAIEREPAEGRRRPERAALRTTGAGVTRGAAALVEKALSAPRVKPA